MALPDEHDYLVHHARLHFPSSAIAVCYDDEIIHLDIDGVRFTFEIGSDDDEYVFTDGKITFTIPPMDFDEDF